MAVDRSKLFDSISTGAAWDAGVVFNRTNAIPIDKFSVFASLSDAEVYASSNPVAYPGQLIAVVPESGEAQAYVILANGQLSRLAVDTNISGLESRISALDEKTDQAITELTNEGSKINYKKANGQTGSFNTTFIGTMAEYEEAYAAGQIAVGTIVFIEGEDEEVEDAGASSPILGTGVLGYLVLG